MTVGGPQGEEALYRWGHGEEAERGLGVECRRGHGPGASGPHSSQELPVVALQRKVRRFQHFLPCLGMLSLPMAYTCCSCEFPNVLVCDSGNRYWNSGCLW